MKSCGFQCFINAVWNGELSRLESERYCVCLTLGYEPSQEHCTYDEVKEIMDSPGYTKGGKDLVVTRVMDNGRNLLKAEPVCWTPSTITSDGACVYLPNRSGLLVCYTWFGDFYEVPVLSSKDKDFELTMPSYLVRM